jgi:hypothetical protein
MNHPHPLPVRSATLLLAGLFAGFIAPAGPAAACRARAADRTVNIALEDQFRTRHETLALRGDVVVLVYAERRGAEAAHQLGCRLHTHFHPTATSVAATEWARQPVVGPAGWPAGVRAPDVHAIPVACLPEVPKALHSVARSRLRKESEHVPVWLDFEGVMRQRFGIVPDEPNVLVIDTHGCAHGVLTGHLDEVRFEELVRVVDGLRMQCLPERTAVVPAGAVQQR